MIETIILLIVTALIAWLGSKAIDGGHRHIKARHLESSHITPAGGDIFLDLGFEPNEAVKLQERSRKRIRVKKDAK